MGPTGGGSLEGKWPGGQQSQEASGREEGQREAGETCARQGGAATPNQPAAAPTDKRGEQPAMGTTHTSAAPKPHTQEGGNVKSTPGPIDQPAPCSREGDAQSLQRHGRDASREVPEMESRHASAAGLQTAVQSSSAWSSPIELCSERCNMPQPVPRDDCDEAPCEPLRELIGTRQQARSSLPQPQGQPGLTMPAPAPPLRIQAPRLAGQPQAGNTPTCTYATQLVQSATTPICTQDACTGLAGSNSMQKDMPVTGSCQQHHALASPSSRPVSQLPPPSNVADRSNLPSAKQQGLERHTAGDRVRMQKDLQGRQKSCSAGRYSPQPRQQGQPSLLKRPEQRMGRCAACCFFRIYLLAFGLHCNACHGCTFMVLFSMMQLSAKSPIQRTVIATCPVGVYLLDCVRVCLRSCK